MSVVIVGGNERMAAQYEEICRCYGCKAKVFCKENGSLKRKMGVPDLLILFTNTVSHKMVISAMGEAKRNRIPVARTHSASSAALHRRTAPSSCLSSTAGSGQRSASRAMAGLTFSSGERITA